MSKKFGTDVSSHFLTKFFLSYEGIVTLESFLIIQADKGYSVNLI